MLAFQDTLQPFNTPHSLWTAMLLSEVQSSLRLPAGADFHGVSDLKHGKMLEVDDWYFFPKSTSEMGPWWNSWFQPSEEAELTLFTWVFWILLRPLTCYDWWGLKTCHGCACCSSDRSYYLSLAQWGILTAAPSTIGNAQPQPSHNQRSAMSRLPNPPASYGTECQVPNVSVSYTFDLLVVAKRHELVSPLIWQPFHCP